MKAYSVQGLPTLGSGQVINNDDLITITVNKPGVSKDAQYIVKYSEFKTLLTALNTISELTSGSGITIDGALIKDGSFTGKQATATATADGLTTGLLTGADQFVVVTSASANNIIALPAIADVPLGTKIRGWVGANGFELRVAAAEATTSKINSVTTNVEAAIPATTFFTVIKVEADNWLLIAETELGARIAAIVPDAV